MAAPAGTRTPALDRRCRRWSAVRAAAVAVAVAAALPGCAGRARPAGAEPPADAVGTIRTAGSGLATPTQIAAMGEMLTSLVAAADGSELLVGSRTGLVSRLERRKVDGFVVPSLGAARPVLDLRDRVSTSAEQGFFDMVVGDSGDVLVVSYTNRAGEVVVERFDYEPGRPIRPDTGTVLVALPWHYPWHHGGGLARTATGDVLVGLGDRGLSVPGTPVSQDPGLMMGGVLAIPRSAVAGDDPDWRATPQAMVARGLRNPWKMSIDPVTEDLWIGEVGNDRSEEVNRVRAAAVASGGTNFGWPYLEGRHVIEPGVDLATMTAPTYERTYGNGVCGMVGGFVYRGRRIPALDGRYVFGDLCDRRLMSFPSEGNGERAPSAVTQVPEPLVSIAEGDAGELYLLGAEGGVYRLDPAGWSVAANRQSPERIDPDVEPPVVGTIDCGVGEAANPLLHLASLPPDELRAQLEHSIEVLRERVPALPDHLRGSGEVVLATFVAFDRRLAPVGWDVDSPDPSLASLRAEIIDGSGDLAGFPAAMAVFMGGECR